MKRKEREKEKKKGGGLHLGYVSVEGGERGGE